MDKYMPNGNLADGSPRLRLCGRQPMALVLKQCGDDLTRDNVMKQAASLKGVEIPLLLPGIKVNTSPTDFYPIQSVQLPRFEGETWKLFGDDPVERRRKQVAVASNIGAPRAVGGRTSTDADRR